MLTFAQMPSLSRNVARPDSREIPAPVSTTILPDFCNRLARIGRASLPEKRQVNRRCHCFIAFIFGMKMIAAVVLRRNVVRICRVLDGFFEVDYGIKRFAASNPFIHGFAPSL